jgi:pimeloyl-ACP methyl ester carboxylesterase
MNGLTHSLTIDGRGRLFRLGALIAAALMLSLVLFSTGARAAESSPSSPTIVLVHGAFADSSSWADVVRRLQARGYTVDVPPNPLRSLQGDSDYLRAFLGTISGPVVLAGHSYGGAVITSAATGNKNVKALVYVNGFAPDTGESVVQLASERPGSALAGDPTQVFDFVPARRAKQRQEAVAGKLAHGLEDRSPLVGGHPLEDSGGDGRLQLFDDGRPPPQGRFVAHARGPGRGEGGDHCGRIRQAEMIDHVRNVRIPHVHYQAGGGGRILFQLKADAF